jgi:hypothetical protein
VVSNLQILTTIADEPCRNERPRFIIDTRDWGAASLTEPHFPICVGFPPGADEFFPSDPLKFIVIDNQYRNPIATGSSPTNRTVTDYDVREISIDLEADSPAIARSACHQIVFFHKFLRGGFKSIAIIVLQTR